MCACLSAIGNHSSRIGIVLRLGVWFRRRPRAPSRGEMPPRPACCERARARRDVRRSCNAGSTVYCAPKYSIVRAHCVTSLEWTPSPALWRRPPRMHARRPLGTPACTILHRLSRSTHAAPAQASPCRRATLSRMHSCSECSRETAWPPAAGRLASSRATRGLTCFKCSSK